MESTLHHPPPSPPPPQRHRQANFIITTSKQPISKAEPIDALSARIGIPVPEMIFGDNAVAITHAPSGWTMAFTAADALDAVGKTGENMLQVSYARDWSRTRGDMAMVKDVVRPFDWSYSTTYRGTVDDGRGQQREGMKTKQDVGGGGSEGEEEEARLKTAASPEGDQQQTRLPPPPPPPPQGNLPHHFRKVSGVEIPLELLKRRDPILFFDDVVLYESELDDNGISLLSVKVRVHAQRMLLLSRLFMRLDGVVVRIRDTRVYVDFETDEVLREYTAREEKFDIIQRALLMSGKLPDDITIALRDANELAPLLPIVEHDIEGISLAGLVAPGKPAVQR